jgi:hypothetical protein
LFFFFLLLLFTFRAISEILVHTERIQDELEG